MLVTGASGNAGREVVAALSRRGIAVRRAARAGGDASAPDAVPFDFEDRGTWGAALAGASGVFLMRPPALTDMRETLVPFARAAREAGAGPIVFLSVAGAERSRWVPHRAVEDALAGDPSATILRPGLFAQNLQDAYRRDIVEDDRLILPAGRARVAFVDLRDVGEVAAMALGDPRAHGGRAWTLTGRLAARFSAVAEALTRALGGPIAYRAVSPPAYMRHLRRRGLGWGAVAILTALHVGLRLGQARDVDPTLASLLGRPPRSVFDYVRDHADLWRRPPI